MVELELCSWVKVAGRELGRWSVQGWYPLMVSGIMIWLLLRYCALTVVSIFNIVVTIMGWVSSLLNVSGIVVDILERP